MPAINVARTDTFEQQRVKINSIAENLFSISAGGSDLSTGILKIGDGSLVAPSLSFTNEDTLGFYRPDNQTLGIASSSKKLANFSNPAFISFRDIIIQKNTVSDIVITNPGSGYDAGTFLNVPMTGGTGENLTSNITVTEYTFTTNSLGSGYDYGEYSDQYLEGGSGSGAVIDFEVVGVRGSITSGGSAYLPGTFSNVPIVNVSSSGSGETATVTIAGTIDYQGSITNVGTGYTNQDYTSKTIFAANPAATYSVTVVSNPGSPPPDNVYQIDGNTQQALTLDVGNTYRFDISDSSVSGHPLIFLTASGSELDTDYFQVLESTDNNFIDFIIKPGAPLGNIQYNCSIHDGMGAAITVQSGTTGIYGHGMIADIKVDTVGEVSEFIITSPGFDYNQNDVVTSDIPGGSGFEYTLGSPIYAGIVTAISFNDDGVGYVQGDTLTINDSDVGNKGGSGFQLTVTSQPGAVDSFIYVTKGDNYQTNDTLQLPDQTTGISGYANGSVELECDYSSGNPTVTVTGQGETTANVAVGMVVSGSTDLEGTETVVSVNSATSITLSAAPAADGTSVLNFATNDPSDSMTVTDVTGIFPGMDIEVTSGDAELFEGTSIVSIDGNTLTLSDDTILPGNGVFTVTPAYGANPTSDLNLTVGTLGVVDGISVNNPGNGYVFQDLLAVNATSLVAPVTYTVTNIDVQIVTFNGTVASSAILSSDQFAAGGDPYDVIYIKETGGNIDYIIIQESEFEDGDTITNVRSSVDFDVNTATDGYRYLINNQLEPSITMYAGDAYIFDVSNDSNNSHVFSFSEFRDGIWAPSWIKDVSVTTTISSAQITVASTTGILAGMAVTVTEGQGIVSNTFVQSVDNATTITLTKPALATGTLTAEFRGVEYTDGVERLEGQVVFRPTTNTPATLYYYCGALGETHANEGGFDYDEVALTVDSNNPRVFGSGAEFVVAEIQTIDSITGDVETGLMTVDSLTAVTSSVDESTVNTKGTAPIYEATTFLKSPELQDAGTGLSINSINTTLSGNLTVGSTGFVVSSATANLTTSGVLKTTNQLNVNDKVRIQNNVVSTISTDDLELTAFTGRVVKVGNTTALVIPSGSNAQRPTSLAANGAIRFNTTTQQYEGYSEDTSSWSSLGGVRDLDGNTTILAEESIGVNDNTLWFINDDINSMKVKKDQLIFEAAKEINSTNTTAPSYINWVANFEYLTVGVYLKYGINIFEIVTVGTSATTGNPPTDTSGNTFQNGTMELKWTHLAVGPIVFNECEEIRIGPANSLPLSINGDLRLTGNSISTDVSDIILRPNSGKKVVIDAGTSLAIPVGGDNDRGVSVQGSIRFNTSSLQYEGYDGTNWGSLGGVKDVDQNTYIIPETAPGANENVLYFYNDNNNTLQLSATSLDFYTIDTVRSVTSDEFELTASLLSIDAGATTLDNTSTTNTFLHSTKQYFDIGISAGLTIDPVLRMDDQGDLFYNIGFGTGSFDGVRIFDKDLKNLEINDLRIHSTDFSLVKGGIETNGYNVYETATERSAKVTASAENITTGDKEFIEFTVIDDGTDVYFAEYGNILTGNKLLVPAFLLTENNEVRLNIDMDSNIAETHVVRVTIIAHTTKK